MKPIDEICSRGATELYNELAKRVYSESVTKIRSAITSAYSDFIPRILPDYLTSSASDLFDQPDVGIRANVFSVNVGSSRRELSFTATRRAWSGVDESFLTEFPPPAPWSGALIGAGGGSEPVPRGIKRPRRIGGMCVLEVSLDWHVGHEDGSQSYTFPLEGVPDLAAICIRVPSGLRLPFTGAARIALLTSELARTFYSWVLETISDAIRKQAVKLSARLYRRPRVLIPDIASTLAFSCLIRGKDFVLFDDQSLTGFVDVMESSVVPTGISALKLSSILLGEIVTKDQSAIAYVVDKADGDHITIKLAESLAYSNDEALRHAITAAWGSEFLCIKLLNHRDGLFVLFCPAQHQDRVITYLKENLHS
ncbi:MAG TPA: hypothetical protein VF688_06775, partial [Allosphingosinicella sp.]